MPFAGYENMDACMAANQDKDDPKAFCGALMAEAEKLARQHTRNRFRIAKTNAAERLVFGWASVAVKADGELLEDLQGDLIEPETLEKAAYDFNLYARGADEMHERRVVGQLVESLVVTPEKLQAMGLTAKAAPTVAWWVGFKVAPDTFAKVQDGTFRMFSIELIARREAA